MPAHCRRAGRETATAPDAARSMTQVWTTFRSDDYVGLLPWCWAKFEDSSPLGHLAAMGGVSAEVLASLRESHHLLLGPIRTAISDVFSRRAEIEDPSLRIRLEDAYAEVVQSRPHLRAHIRCGREPDGTFRWEFPVDPTQTVPVIFTGVRVMNAVTKQTARFGFDRPIAPDIGKFLGLLNGTHTVSELQRVAAESDPDLRRSLTLLMELLSTHKCLATSACPSHAPRWLRETCDRDIVHLGHAGLLYRQQNTFLLFDPWLVPWFAETRVPSLWVSLVPRPSAIFLTHEHDDHLDQRTLLMMPKDIPIVVPSRTNRRALFFDYRGLLQELGFCQIIELAHGESWAFDGGKVVSVPFFGEDPCDMKIPRNCYLISDHGHNTLVLADSGQTNSGSTAVKEGVIDDLVRRHGPIATVFASQQQIVAMRTYSDYACLSEPGKWLEIGEDSCLTNGYLAQLAASARARLFVSYATGAADWYPDYRSFMFCQNNTARTAVLTAHWEPLDQLKQLLAPYGCGYHYSHPLDLFRPTADGGTGVLSGAEALDPFLLFGGEHGDG